jgi:hypothetical protein
VAHAGQEGALLALAVLDVGGHLVEGGADLCHLVVALHLHPGRQLPGSQLPGGPGQPAQRRGQPAGQQPGDQRGDRHGQRGRQQQPPRHAADQTDPEASKGVGQQHPVVAHAPQVLDRLLQRGDGIDDAAAAAGLHRALVEVRPQVDLGRGSDRAAQPPAEQPAGHRLRGAV